LWDEKVVYLGCKIMNTEVLLLYYNFRQPCHWKKLSTGYMEFPTFLISVPSFMIMSNQNYSSHFVNAMQLLTPTWDVYLTIFFSFFVAGIPPGY
jgi:hypothetical protein